MKQTPTDRGAMANIWRWIAVVAAVLGAVYLFWGRSGSVSGLKSELPPHALSSSAAPGFTLTDIHGKQISLADFRGKVVVLDFWATWCPPCRREIPDFISLQSQYGGKGLQVVGIALDEPDKVKQYAAAMGMNYAVLLGDDATSALYGGIEGIPTTFIIDRQGKIVNRFEGFTARDEFEKEIAKLL